MLRPTSLAEDIRAIAPDVVHTHSGGWYKVSRAVRMAGVPFHVHTDHGRNNPDPWLHRFIDRQASANTDVIVAVSELLGAQLRHIVRRPERVRVIPNGVNVDTYAPGPDDGALRRALGIAAETPIVGSVGRLEWIKGYDVMIAAFAQLLATWSEHETGLRPVLVLIGDGQERAALEQAATDTGCRGSVHFLGWRSDILECERAFTCFTMSSRSEGTSVSLLEAMSAGLCPIVTAVGGNPVVLGDTLAHRLVPPQSPDALADAWRTALRDAGQRASDARAARARVQSAFSLDAMVRAYERVYVEGPLTDAPAARVASLNTPAVGVSTRAPAR
jgi:glycosyltransferase involved in cell wall biosynthesis